MMTLGLTNLRIKEHGICNLYQGEITTKWKLKITLLVAGRVMLISASPYRLPVVWGDVCWQTEAKLSVLL